MGRILISLKFGWDSFVIFWILFTLLFSINDFIWKYYTEKSLDFLYLPMIFITNLLNPFQILVRIKTGLYDIKAMFTFIVILLFSFGISFIKIRSKDIKTGKTSKASIIKYKRRRI